MLPYINIFGYEIASYGTIICIGFFVGILVSTYRAKIYDLNKEDVFFASLYAVIGLLVGAKLLYIAINIPEIIKNFDYIVSNPRIIMNMLQGGFVFYGGLMGSVVGIYIYCKQYNIKFLDITENLTPSVPLIHAFGRIGCFCAGCCYGIPYEAPIGLMFNNSQIAPHNITLFPVQLFESILNLLLFVCLMIYGRKRLSKGKLLCIYLIAYAVIRFILEYFRYDAERGILLGISTSQWISILLVMIVFIVYLKNKRKRV